MATYIDLNPVRAGLTDDPCTHRYAEAIAGKANALEGIARITRATSSGSIPLIGAPQFLRGDD